MKYLIIELLRKCTLIIGLGILLQVQALYGQVPQSFMLQGLAQDFDGNPMVLEEVAIEVFLDGQALDHEPVVTTSSAGVFRVEITGVDLMDLLRFGDGVLEVNVDGIPLSTPLLSVPYALLAEEVVNDAFEDDDADPTNELQTLDFIDGKLIISDGNEISIPTGGTDADADPTNELQTLSFSDGKLSITDGNEIDIPTGGTDADADPTNELQTLSFSDGKLSITDGNEITIPTGSTDADADPTNEIQELKLEGTTLSIVPQGEGSEFVTLQDGGGGTSVWTEAGNKIYYNGGNVGIGTSNPSSELEVDGTVKVADELLVMRGTAAKVQLATDGGNGELNIYDSKNRKVVKLRANGDFNDPSGDFGYMELLGPNGKKNVVLGFIGSGTEQDRGAVGVYNENDQAWWMSTGSKSNPDLSLYYLNGNNLKRLGEFSTTNGQYSTLSDRRAKENIRPLSNVLSSLIALKAMRYNYKHDEEKRPDFGFIAQEVRDVFPELVNEMDDRLGVNYSGFSVLAIKAIQEQQNTIEEQAVLIKDLVERVTRLEKQQIKSIK